MININSDINWIKQQAESTPDSTAVEAENASLTFSELHAEVLKVSSQLNLIGVRSNDCVGLL
jgi:non-ribosomal peptide synthetase component F